LKARAESQLNRSVSPAQMRLMSGQYSEAEWVRSEATSSQADDATVDANTPKGRLVVKLSPVEWYEAISNLERIFAEPGKAEIQAKCLSCPIQIQASVNRAESMDALASGRVSSLQEDHQRFYATAVLSQSTDHLKIATVEWRKTDFDQWWAGAKDQFSAQAQTLVHPYQLPAVSQVACTDDTWKATKLLPEGVLAPKPYGPARR